MRKSKRAKTRRRSSSPLKTAHSAKRDLAEDLHRYDVSISEQPDLFAIPTDHPTSRSPKGGRGQRGSRLTRLQSKQVGMRRLMHLLQFLFLLAVLFGLTVLLIHSITLYF